MSLKEQLIADMKEAMKEREAGKLRLGVIRMVRASIKNNEINGKQELTEDQVLAVLLKEVKLRQDALAEFTKAQRQDLIEQTKAEIAVLQKYLPAAMSDEELRTIVQAAVAQVGAVSVKQLGKVMPLVLAQTKGRADGKRVNAMVREVLQ